MKRVIIRNQAGVQTHGAEMEDPSAWIAEGKEKNWWGKPERWVRAEQEDISGALETREVEIFPAVPDSSYFDEETQTEIFVPGTPAVIVTEYRLAAEYTVVVTDISAEVAAAEAEKKAKAKAIKDAVDQIKAFKDKDPSTAEIKTIVKALVQWASNQL